MVDPLINTTTGDVEASMDEADASLNVASGQVAPATGSSYNILEVDSGETRTISDPATIAQLLRNPNYRIETPLDIKIREKTAALNNDTTLVGRLANQTVDGVAIGGIDLATDLSLLNRIENPKSEEDRTEAISDYEALRRHREQHMPSRFVGEAIGTIGSLYYGGPLVGAGTRAAARATSRTIQTVVGKEIAAQAAKQIEKYAVSRAIAGAASGTARLATEGALYSSPRIVAAGIAGDSEDVMREAATGAAFNIVLGGGFNLAASRFAKTRASRASAAGAPTAPPPGASAGPGGGAVDDGIDDLVRVYEDIGVDPTSRPILNSLKTKIKADDVVEGGVERVEESARALAEEYRSIPGLADKNKTQLEKAVIWRREREAAGKQIDEVYRNIDEIGAVSIAETDVRAAIAGMGTKEAQEEALSVLTRHMAGKPVYIGKQALSAKEAAAAGLGDLAERPAMSATDLWEVTKAIQASQKVKAAEGGRSFISEFSQWRTKTVGDLAEGAASQFAPGSGEQIFLSSARGTLAGANRRYHLLSDLSDAFENTLGAAVIERVAAKKAAEKGADKAARNEKVNDLIAKMGGANSALKEQLRAEIEKTATAIVKISEDVQTAAFKGSPKSQIEAYEKISSTFGRLTNGGAAIEGEIKDITRYLTKIPPTHPQYKILQERLAYKQSELAAVKGLDPKVVEGIQEQALGEVAAIMSATTRAEMLAGGKGALTEGATVAFHAGLAATGRFFMYNLAKAGVGAVKMATGPLGRAASAITLGIDDAIAKLRLPPGGLATRLGVYAKGSTIDEDALVNDPEGVVQGVVESLQENGIEDQAAHKKAIDAVQLAREVVVRPKRGAMQLQKDRDIVNSIFDVNKFSVRVLSGVASKEEIQYVSQVYPEIVSSLRAKLMDAQEREGSTRFNFIIQRLHGASPDPRLTRRVQESYLATQPVVPMGGGSGKMPNMKDRGTPASRLQQGARLGSR